MICIDSTAWDWLKSDAAWFCDCGWSVVMARRHVVHSGSVQVECFRGGLSCTLLAEFVRFGRFQGGAYRKKTVEWDNDVHRSSVQDGGERESASPAAEEAGSQNREGAAPAREGADEYGFLRLISEKVAEIS